MLNLDYWHTERLLADRGVPISDLQADRATLDEICLAGERSCF